MLPAAQALSRASGDGAALLAFGACLFAATLVPPRLRAGAEGRAVRLARAAAPVVALATLLRLPLAAAGMGDGWAAALDPETLLAVLTGTAVGRAWAAQMGAAALLAAAAALRGSAPALAWSAGLVLVSLALSGHAAAVPGPAGRLARGALALHLLAGGAWIGSLPEVLRLMAASARGAGAGDAARALRRFSAAGHGAVAAMIAAGAAATGWIAELSRALPASAYGAVLLGKLALAAAMTALAVVNRYRLVPYLPGDAAASRAMLRNTRAVLGLGLGAVAASGLLGLLDPP